MNASRLPSSIALRLRQASPRPQQHAFVLEQCNPVNRLQTNLLINAHSILPLTAPISIFRTDGAEHPPALFRSLKLRNSDGAPSLTATLKLPTQCRYNALVPLMSRPDCTEADTWLRNP